MFNQIHAVTHFNRKALLRSVLGNHLTAIMGVVVALGTFGLHFVISPTARFGSVVYLVLMGALGVRVWIPCARHHLLDKLIGSKAKVLRQNYIWNKKQSVDCFS